MSFYRLKYLWPKNSTNATAIIHGLRCMQTTSNQLAASSKLISVHNRHHHTLLQRDLASSAQIAHNEQVNIGPQFDRHLARNSFKMQSTHTPNNRSKWPYNLLNHKR